jgi:hypothetical protein
MYPSESQWFLLPSSHRLRATQLSRPDAVVWLGTLLLVTGLFVVFFVL